MTLWHPCGHEKGSTTRAGPADGGRTLYAIHVSVDDEEISSPCVLRLLQEPSSAAEDRVEMHFGSFSPDRGRRGSCSASDAFIADGAPTYERVDGENWWYHEWAQIEPEVLAEILDTDDDTSTDHLAEAGLATEDSPEGATATVTHSFDGDALREVRCVFRTDTGARVLIVQQFYDLGEEQGIVVSEDPFLEPESDPITTVGELEWLIGFG